MSSPGALGTLGGRLSRDTALFGSANAITFVAAVINLAVLTRLLEVGDFGQLAVLLFFAALLTILYNLGSLQGTFMHVFGASAEEGIVDEDADDASVGKKRRALGSALTLTFLIGTLGTALVTAFAEPISRALLGEADLAGAVVLAGISAALGSLWRLLTNVLRYERRPASYVALSSLRPMLVLASTVPLVSSGGGIEGAVGGVALGTALAVIAALVITRRSYAPAFNRDDLRSIFSRGTVYVPVVLSFWVLHSADIYVVSLFSSNRQVALYRVASRIAAGVGYFVSAFMMAWAPLTRTSLHQAVVRERGAPDATASVLTWFALACLWILLALAVLADVLIRIAPEDYAAAAPLIPVVSLGFVAYGAYVMVYYGTPLPGKRRRYVALAVIAALAFLVLGLALAPVLGGYGVALAQIVVFACAAGNLLRASSRAGTPFPFEWRPVFRALAVVVALLGLGLLVGPELGSWRIAVDLVAVAAYPALLVAIGVVPRRDVVQVFGLVRRQARRSPPLGPEALSRLELADRRALELLLHRREPVAAVAEVMRKEERALLRDTVAVLRRAAQAGPPSDADDQLGAYLLVGDAVAERDAVVRGLWKSGEIEPIDIDALERFVGGLRQASAGRWAAAIDGSPPPVPALARPLATARRMAPPLVRRALGRPGRPTFRRVVAGLGLPNDSRVLDLGAGGFAGQTTTRHLIERFDPPVVAVERSPDRAATLLERFGERVVVVVADAFGFEPDEPADLLVIDLDSGVMPRVYEELLPRARDRLVGAGGIVVMPLVSDHSLAYSGPRRLPAEGAEAMGAFLQRCFGALRVDEDRLRLALRGSGWELVGLHPKYEADRCCFVHWAVLRDHRTAGLAAPEQRTRTAIVARPARRTALAQASGRLPGKNAREVRRLVADGRTMFVDLVIQAETCDERCTAMVNTWTDWARTAFGGTLDPERTFGSGLQSLAGYSAPGTEFVVPSAAMALLPVPESAEAYRAGIDRKARTAVRKAERLGYEVRAFSRNDHLEEIAEINTSKPVRSGGPMTQAYLDPPRSRRDPPGRCDRHRTLHVGAFREGRLRAYAQVELVGELAILNTMIGHAGSLPDGVMVRLVEGLATEVSASGRVKAIDYLGTRAASTSLERYKRSVGFSAHAVLLRGVGSQ